MRKQAWKNRPLLGQKLLESEGKTNVEWLPREILLGRINTPPFGASFASGGPMGTASFTDACPRGPCWQMEHYCLVHSLCGFIFVYNT